MPEDSPLWSGVEGPPTDPERAAALVEETIAEGVWDGSFTFTHGVTPNEVDLAVLIEGMWEAVGMDVTPESTPNGAPGSSSTELRGRDPGFADPRPGAVDRR